MAGNVWEWTRSLWGREQRLPEYGYPYDPDDGREDTEAGRDCYRVLRGGAFVEEPGNMRCAGRNGNYPHYRHRYNGFRLAISPLDKTQPARLSPLAKAWQGMTARIKPIPIWGTLLGGLGLLGLAGVIVVGMILLISSLIPAEPVSDTLSTLMTQTREAAIEATSAYAAQATVQAQTDTPRPNGNYSATPEPTTKDVPSAGETPPTDATLGDTWTRPADGAEMVYVPAGEFLMGSSEDDPDAYSNEKPRHTVSLDAFWIDKHEITNAQYAAFLNDQGNQEEGGSTWLDLKSGYCLIEEVGGQFQ
jgi:formylglycine-generating enzyme required for sulfatase activity